MTPGRPRLGSFLRPRPTYPPSNAAASGRLHARPFARCLEPGLALPDDSEPGSASAGPKGRGNDMEIVIAAVVVALGLAAGLVLAASRRPRRARARAGSRGPGSTPAPAVPVEPMTGGSIEADLKERRGEMVRLE